MDFAAMTENYFIMALEDPDFGMQLNTKLPGSDSILAAAARLPDMEAKGYRTSVVDDPASTILLAEEPNGQGAAGNIWPCICNGPSGSGALYQIDALAPPQNPTQPTGVNQGKAVYKAHGQRFNYLFHDGHVQSLRMTETVGTGTTNNPRGMWTVAKGD